MESRKRRIARVIARRTALTLLPLLPWLASSVAQAQSTSGALKLTTGLDLSSGKYGESENTDILIVPTTLSYARFPWTLSASVAYFDVNGPSDITVGIDGIIPQSSESQTQTGGLGDLTLGSSWAADSLWNISPFFLDLTWKLKIPTADENSGLSTGQTDTQFQADLAYAAGRLTPTATLGYKLTGNSDYKNQLITSTGLDFGFRDKLHIGVFFDYRSAATENTDARREALFYLTSDINPRLTLTGYSVTGFSDASPDLGAGLLMTVR